MIPERVKQNYEAVNLDEERDFWDQIGNLTPDGAEQFCIHDGKDSDDSTDDGIIGSIGSGNERGTTLDRKPVPSIQLAELTIEELFGPMSARTAAATVAAAAIAAAAAGQPTQRDEHIPEGSRGSLRDAGTADGDDSIPASW